MARRIQCWETESPHRAHGDRERELKQSTHRERERTHREREDTEREGAHTKHTHRERGRESSHRGREGERERELT